MKKVYHFSKNSVIARCHAKGTCPLGGLHGSEQELQKVLEEKLKNQYGNVHTIHKDNLNEFTDEEKRSIKSIRNTLKNMNDTISDSECETIGRQFNELVDSTTKRIQKDSFNKGQYIGEDEILNKVMSSIIKTGGKPPFKIYCSTPKLKEEVEKAIQKFPTAVIEKMGNESLGVQKMNRTQRNLINGVEVDGFFSLSRSFDGEPMESIVNPRDVSSMHFQDLESLSPGTIEYNNKLVTYADENSGHLVYGKNEDGKITRFWVGDHVPKKSKVNYISYRKISDKVVMEKIDGTKEVINKPLYQGYERKTMRGRVIGIKNKADTQEIAVHELTHLMDYAGELKNSEKFFEEIKSSATKDSENNGFPEEYMGSSLNEFMPCATSNFLCPKSNTDSSDAENYQKINDWTAGFWLHAGKEKIVE